MAEWLRQGCADCYANENWGCVWRTYYALGVGGAITQRRYAATHMGNFLFKGGDIFYPPGRSGWVPRDQAVQFELPGLQDKALKQIRSFARQGRMKGGFEVTADVDPDNRMGSDMYFAMGSFDLTLRADYEVTELDDGRYLVVADMTYEFHDKYDWHDTYKARGPVEGVEDFEDAWAAALHDQGIAAEFSVSGWWPGGTSVHIFGPDWLTSSDPVTPHESYHVAR